MLDTTLWKICHDQYFTTRVKLRSEKTRIQYRLALSNGKELVLEEEILSPADRAWIKSRR